MKESELRVGNLFRFISTNSIESVSDIKTHGLKTPVINNVSIKDTEPIPLTEEWLLRFGFSKKDKSSYWYPNKCWHRYCFGYTKFGGAYLNLEPEGGIVPHATCYYVHQLQNLYFALTQKELIIK